MPKQLTGLLLVLLLGLMVVGLAPARASAATLPLPPIPIPGDPRTSLFPSFIGTTATPQPVSASAIPPSVHMAANGRSNIHDDAYMSDTYTGGGPLGRDTRVTSTYLLPGGECASVTFDRAGRIVSVCIGATPSVVIGGTSNVNLAMFDPHSLALLATYPLPQRSFSGNLFNDFSGGGYFFLDDQDRAVISTANKHLMVLAETAGPGFQLTADYDLSAGCPSIDKISSALPDNTGRIWFVSFNGYVGTLDLGSSAIKCVNLTPGEAMHLPKGKSTAEIENSFAIEPASSGVYIVSETALYRFDPANDGAPAVTWQKFYDRTEVQKPGQVDTGSGTTPTLMGSNLVSVTDNADPMNVVVYRRSDGQQVCKQPVFGTAPFKLPSGSPSTYASDTENSLIGTDTSMVAENNYGYASPLSTSGGNVTHPGLQRVDLDPGGGCHIAWTSMERAPSVVAKLSLANGLLYSYTKPLDTHTATPNPPLGADPWYLTAIDFSTGQTAFSRLAGVGVGFNNNYAPVTLGPDGTAYVGVLGGLVAFSEPSTATGPTSPGGGSNPVAPGGLPNTSAAPAEVALGLFAAGSVAAGLLGLSSSRCRAGSSRTTPACRPGARAPRARDPRDRW